MMHRTLALVAGLSMAAVLPNSAAEKIDTNVNAKIRQEETSHSQVLRTLHFLTDVHGPRLTGSPAHKEAAEWAVKQMTEWGFTNGHLEPWDFGHPGWTNDYLSVHIVSPVKDALVVEALAWTPGTDGRKKMQAVMLITPEGPEAPANPDAAGGRGPQRLGPTQAELTAYFDSIKGRVSGAAVLVGKPVFVPVNLTPPTGRMTDDQAKCRFDPDAANAPECQGRGGFGQRGGGGGGGRGPQPEGRLSAADVARQIDQFLVANKAGLRVNDAGRAHGQIIAFNNRTFDVSQAVPTVVMRNEDYGRIARILADATPVELEAEIVNKTYPDGKTSYNAIAEIAGSDKKDEVVMLGGHLDSWHSATGATDNAIGCAVMMEAARILKAIGVQPRRTIRVALWSGEEEGLLGSLAYVKEHFGSAEIAQAGVREVCRLPQHRLGHRPRARRERVRAAGRGRDPARDRGTVQGSRRGGSVGDEQPQRRRHRQHLVQQRRPARHRVRTGPDRVRQPHPSHEPRHLRACDRGRRARIGDHDRLGALSSRDARRSAAALPGRQNAAAGAGTDGRTVGGTRGSGLGTRLGARKAVLGCR